MQAVHAPMPIGTFEFDTFNGAVISTLATAGVAPKDQLTVLSVLNSTKSAICNLPDCTGVTPPDTFRHLLWTSFPRVLPNLLTHRREPDLLLDLELMALRDENCSLMLAKHTVSSANKVALTPSTSTPMSLELVLLPSPLESLSHRTMNSKVALAMKLSL
jgi:hypothetical protein